MSKKELTAEETEGIKEFFDLFDKNGDGNITAEELIEVLSAWGGTTTTIEEVNKFIEIYDEDKDGELNFQEFIQWWTNLENELL